MIPRTLRGRIFCSLTFLNTGLASYFFAIGLGDQGALSSASALLCATVWISDILTED